MCSSAFRLKIGRMPSFEILSITSTSANTRGVYGIKTNDLWRLQARTDRIPWYWKPFIKDFVKEWAPRLPCVNRARVRNKRAPPYGTCTKDEATQLREAS